MLRINKDIKVNNYTCYPKTKAELKSIIIKRIEKDKDADLNDIDVSAITDMSELFYSIFNIRNIDISEWDVSNVKTMSMMFMECRDFNCDLSKWNVSKVKDMSSMFENCNSFNSDLSKWNVSNCENFNFMFCECTKFDADLEDWDISNGKEDMSYMFNGCESLKNRPTWEDKFV